MIRTVSKRLIARARLCARAKTLFIVCAATVLTARLLRHFGRSSLTTLPEDGDIRYIAFMKESLRTLRPRPLPIAGPQFRRVLIRERVGIEGHMYPEYYFSEHMLPKLTGKTTILDIGANVGQFAIPIAKNGHRVISIEPNEKTCEKLKENLAETKFTTQIEVHCVAAGETTGFVTFANNSVSTSFTQSRDVNTGVRIPVSRVDDLAPDGEDILLLKTDTQGYELSVLKGAVKLLATRVHFLMVEFSYGLMGASGTDPLELLHFIYDRGFICTYMAYHTMLKSGTYGTVPTEPDFTQDSVPFARFVESLRTVSSLEAAGHSGWTDLLCARAH